MEGCGLEDVQSAILIVYMASWPSGKARVCKILIRGSNPLDASSKANQIWFAFLFKSPDFGAKSGDFVVPKKTVLLHPQETPLADLQNSSVRKWRVAAFKRFAIQSHTFLVNQ